MVSFSNGSTKGREAGSGNVRDARVARSWVDATRAGDRGYFRLADVRTSARLPAGGARGEGMRGIGAGAECSGHASGREV